MAYVFDRTNGQPVWPIPDVPVPQTDVPTEWTPPTQPIPTKPPAFDVSGVTVDDLINFTPALREEARAPSKAIDWAVVRSAVVGRQRQQRNDRRAGLRRRRELAGRRSRSETGFVYVGSLTQPVRRRCCKDRSARSERKPTTRRDEAARCRRSGTAVVEASLWTNHRVRHEQRRHRVGGSEWRYAAEHQGHLLPNSA